MNRFDKKKGLSLKKADPAADMEIINRYSVKELSPDDVFCFSVVLCDNDIDRDYERFTNAALDKLAELFVGKTGITDHMWTAEGQIARLYRVEVEETAQKNALGEPLRLLRGCAYMLNTEDTRPVIDAIEAGIKKEVSIGCAVEKCTCSVCGEEMSWGRCSNGHIKGEVYDGKTCVGNLEDPYDAYEFSFVAVPAQRGAGVTKSAANAKALLTQLMSAELDGCEREIAALMPRLQFALCRDAERAERNTILSENKKFLKDI